MSRSNGPLIGTVVIVILLVLGAIYVFMDRQKSNSGDTKDISAENENIDNEALTIEAELDSQEKEMDDLEKELETNY